MQSFLVPTEQDMLEFGYACATSLSAGAVLFLNGDLGAGKTTWTRGLLRGFGYEGNVTSPTYTLVEDYPLSGHHIIHFDLYRMESPQELEAIGIRDMLDGQAIAVFEWPERGQGVLPGPDWIIDIQYSDTGRIISTEIPVDWPLAVHSSDKSADHAISKVVTTK